MAQDAVTEKIIEDFINAVSGEGVLDARRLEKLKTVLVGEKVRKADILKALEGEEDENP